MLVISCHDPARNQTNSFQVDRLYSRKRKTKQEREATERGRLSTASLKSLYDDRIRLLPALLALHIQFRLVLGL